MRKIAIIREKVTRLVSLLAERKIKVTQRGANAYVSYDGKTLMPVVVNIPYIPEDADDTFLLAIEGFLDHEVGHVLFTDGKTRLEARKRGVYQEHNMFDDPFVERMMSEKFRGCAHNLSGVGQFYLDTYVKPRLEGETDKKTILGLLMPAAVRAAAGQQVFIDFMADKKHHLGPLEKIIDDLAPELQAAKTSWDTLEVAVKFKKAIAALRPPSPPESEEGEGEEGESGSPKAGEGSEKDDREEGEGREEGGSESAERTDDPSEDETDMPEDTGDDAEPSEGEPEETEPGSGDESGEGDKSEAEGEPTEGEGEPEAGESAGEPEGDDATEGEDDASVGTAGDHSDGDASEEGSESEEGEGGESETATESDVSMAERDPLKTDPAKVEMDYEVTPKDIEEIKAALEEVKDFDDAMSDSLSKEAAEVIRSTEYRVYSTEFDTIEPVDTRGYDDAQGKALIDAVDHMVGPLQKDLERAVAARSLAVMTAGHRSGRLHGAALSRLTVFGDERVFRRKHVSHTKDVAVELVVDCSGSMGMTGRITTATYAAYALSQVLERLRIDHEVIGFTTGEDISNKVGRGDYAKSEKAVGGYTRCEAIRMPIFKGWGERVSTETMKRFAVMSSYGYRLANNIDGESVRIAADRLRRQNKERKLMIVLSDGEPAAHGDMVMLQRDLKKAVQEIEQSGIEVVSIGIQTEAPKKFYSKSVCLNRINDLPAVVIGELKRMLMKV